MPFIAIFASTLLLCLTIAQTLIKNGDFEAYSQPPLYSSFIEGKEQYKIYIIDGNSPQIYGWYQQGHVNISLRTKIVPQYFHITTVLDLYYKNQTQNICQQITQLNISQKYILRFDYTINDRINCGTVMVYWNKHSIFNHKICKSWKVNRAAIQVDALPDINIICFNATIIPFSSQYGLLIDNVTLNLKKQEQCLINGCDVCLDSASCNKCRQTFILKEGVCLSCTFLIPNCTKCSSVSVCEQCVKSFSLFGSTCLFRQTVNLVIEQRQDQTINTLQVICNMSLNQYNLSVNTVSQSTKIYIKGATQQFELSLIEGRVIYKVGISEQFMVADIIRFEFQQIRVLRNKSILFVVKDQTLIPIVYIEGSKKETIEKLESMNQVISSSVNNLFTYTKSLWFGSLVFNLLSYFNLAILYNYVIIYKPSFVTTMIENIFNNLANPGILDIVNLRRKIESNLQYGYIERISSDKSWLNKDFGLTSNFLLNNSDTLCLLCLAVCKLVMVRLLYAITGWKWLKFQGKYFQILLSEVISMSPYLIVSSAITILKNPISGYSFSNKMNIMLNVVGFYAFGMASVFYFCNKIIEVEKEFQGQKREVKKRLCLNQFIDHLLIMSIPLTVALQQPIIFFLSQTIIVIFKISIYRHNKLYFQPFQRVQKLISLMIWTCYHICFILFAIFDFLLRHNYKVDTIIYYSSFLGILTLIVLLLGGLMELLFAFFSLIGFIFQSLKHKCKFRNTIHDEQTIINSIHKATTEIQQINIFNYLKQPSQTSFLEKGRQHRERREQSSEKNEQVDQPKMETIPEQKRKRNGFKTYKERQINEAANTSKLIQQRSQSNSQVNLHTLNFSKRNRIPYGKSEPKTVKTQKNIHDRR